jgi:hypothetical protein
VQNEANHVKEAVGLPKQIDSVKHLLWHGNVAEALDRMADMLLDLELIRAHSVPAEKLATGLAEFEIYIRNNQEFIPNFGERYRQGETISTAFVESTINQVVSRRFVKKQQMQWTRQETTDAVDIKGRTPVVAVPNQSVKQRTGGRFPALVSAVSRSGKGRGLTPDLEGGLPLAGFAGARPHLPGGRKAIPAAFRYAGRCLPPHPGGPLDAP